MAVTDTVITDWEPDFGAADTNTPTATTQFSSLPLSDELRNLKSVVRAESVDKQWERWLGIASPWSPSASAPTYISATSFSLPGNWTAASAGYYPVIALVNRRIKATVTAGTVYGSIVSASYAGGITTVTLAMDSGMALDSGLSEVMWGIIDDVNGALPPTVLKQTNTPLYCVISNGGSGAAFTGTLAPAITAYLTGQKYRLLWTEASVGADTVNLNSLGAIAVKKNGNTTALAAGDIPAGAIVEATYDGTVFQIGQPIIAPSIPTVVGLPGIRNLRGSNVGLASATQFKLNADWAILTNAAGVAMVEPGIATLTLDISSAGPIANGRDQSAAFAASATIHVYYIGGAGQATALIASLSIPSVGPTLPANYTSWAYIGSFVLNSSGDFYPNTQLNGNRISYLDAAGLTAVLTTGTATAETIVPVGALVPTIAQSFDVSLERYIDDTSISVHTLNLRVITGQDYRIFNWQSSNVVSYVDTELTLPIANSTAQFLYLWSASQQTNQLTVYVKGYTVPNNS